jgi:mono/diheme cytochrome c family protein
VTLRSALALLLLAVACGGGEAPPPKAPAAELSVTAPPPAAEIPSGNLRGDATAGARIYGQFCATCHGAGGKGDGPLSQIEPKPADHTDSAYMGSLSDQHLYKVISQGGASVGKSPLMAPWGGVLTDPQIRDLIAQLRALSGT